MSIATTSVPSVSEEHRPLWRRCLRFVWDHTLNTAFVHFMTKRIFLSRMVPIMILLFLTINPWGTKNFIHWTWVWIERLSGGTPGIPPGMLGHFIIFCLATVALLWAFVWLNSRCTSFLRMIWFRALSVALFAAVVVSPLPALLVPWWHYDYWHWVIYWRDVLFPISPWDFGAKFGWWLFSFVCMVGAWGYVLTKAWQGLGSSRSRVVFVAAFIAAFTFLLWTTVGLPSDAVWLMALIELFIGLGIGGAYAFTMVDRFMSGTVGSTAVIKANEAEWHHPGHHDDGGDSDQLHHHPGDDPGADAHQHHH